MTIFSGFLALLDGPSGVAFTLALLALLIVREALPAASGARLRRRRTGLTLVLIPLVVLLLASLASRLVTVAAPVFAQEFAYRQAAPESPTALTPPAATAAGAANVTVVASAGSVSSPQEIATATGALRSGQFDTQIAYANGTTSTSTFRFDLGDDQRPARLASRTTFQGPDGERVTERVAIGGQAWSREAGDAWVVIQAGQSVREEVLARLPDARAVVRATHGAPDNALRWYDPARDADALLETDPITGVPQRMQQTTRGIGTVLTVVYRGWNTVVTIAPPTGQ